MMRPVLRPGTVRIAKVPTVIPARMTVRMTASANLTHPFTRYGLAATTAGDVGSMSS